MFFSFYQIASLSTETTDLTLKSTQTVAPFDSLIYGLFLNIINSQNDEAIKTLEEQGLNIDVKLNKYGWTPLHAAAYKGNTDLVKYLLDKGADKERLNNSGATPKQLATDAGHSDIVELMDKSEQTVEIPIRSEREWSEDLNGLSSSA
mgnify:CR=1 FL=1